MAHNLILITRAKRFIQNVSFKEQTFFLKHEFLNAKVTKSVAVLNSFIGLSLLLLKH